MSIIKIKNTLFPCTDNPEIPYLRFHKDNIYYANLDPEEYINGNYKPLNNDNIIPQVYNVYKNSSNYYLQDDYTLNNPQTYLKDQKEYLNYNLDNTNNFFNPKEITVNGINFIELPILYYKYSTNNWSLSNKPVEGFHVHPAFMYNGKSHKIRIAKDITTGNFNEIINELNNPENKGFHVYNIYEHSLLYIMMGVTCPDSMSNKTKFLMKNKSDEYDLNISFLGIDHIMGICRFDPYSKKVLSKKELFIYGLEFTKNENTFPQNYNIHILKNDGSGEIIDTGLKYSSPGQHNNKYCQRLMSDHGDGYDFRDLLLLDTTSITQSTNPFGEYIIWNYAVSNYERGGIVVPEQLLMGTTTGLAVNSVCGGLTYRSISMENNQFTFRIAQYV